MAGPASSRLSLLWRSVRQATRVSEWPWHAAQNLLLPLSIVAILALILPLALSGHATYEDWGTAWGGEWAADALAEAHEAIGQILLITVLGHLALILVLSLMRRRNLALPMLTGRSDAARSDAPL